MEKVKQCTFCKKEFDNFKMLIKFHTETHRRMQQDVWEKIGNLDVTNHEIVCEDCFNKFIDSFEYALQRAQNEEVEVFETEETV